MEHFTKRMSDDFVDYNVTNGACNGLPVQTKVEGGEEGETPAMKDSDIEALLNRAPIRFRHRRSKPLEEAPEFVKRLNAFEEVKAGTDVVFACQWKAFPNPTVKWYCDDEDITDSTECLKESQINGTETLTLKRPTKKDEGAYKCKVENQEGVASTTGYLSVTGDIAEVSLSTLHKKNKSEHSISSAPHLRTIVEQKSVEEREADAAEGQDPSPLQTFIDNFRREKTWPMCGTGYDIRPGEDGTITDIGAASRSDQAEGDGSDSSTDSQDYDRASFTVNNQQDNESNNLTVEPMIRAPSIEDIMGTIEADSNHDEDNYLQNQTHTDKIPDTQTTLPKLDINNEGNNQDDEEEKTPTNTLDGPEFVTNTPKTTETGEKSQSPEPQLRDYALLMSRMLADQLEVPFIYYFLFTTCCASFAAGTEMPVPYFVMIVAVFSLISFRFLCHNHL